MKRVTNALAAGVAIAVLCSGLSGVHVLAYSGGGAGTLADPYRITTCGQLAEIATNAAAHYKLAGSLYCNGASQSPIGTLGTAFTGSFDGDGYSVNDIAIAEPTTDNVGLFGVISGGTVKNVQLVNLAVSGNQNVGGLVGLATNSAVISNVTVQNSTVIGSQNIGGLAGSLESATTVADSAAIAVDVSGHDIGTVNQVGGFVGICDAASITRSWSTGTVTGNTNSGESSSVGGFAGRNVNGGVITDSYTRTQVTTSPTDGNSGGGFVGKLINGTLNRVYAAGSITGASRIGGVAGELIGGDLMQSFAAGGVTGVSDVAAIVGLVTGGFGGKVELAVYDMDRTTQSGCTNGSGVPTMCAGLNSGNSDPTFFYTNTTYAPTNTWDFSAVWQLVPNDFPVLITEPESPTNNVRVSRTATSLTVSWDASTTNGSSVTGYDVAYGLTGFTAQTVAYAISATSYIITGLSPDTTYYVQLRALSAAGSSPWTGIVTTTLAAPAAANSSTSAASTSKPVVAATQRPVADLAAGTNPVVQPVSQTVALPTPATPPALPPPAPMQTQPQPTPAATGTNALAVWAAVALIGTVAIGWFFKGSHKG